MQAGIFKGLESIWQAFWLAFQKEAPNNIFIVKFKHSPGVKILEFKSNRTN